MEKALKLLRCIATMVLAMALGCAQAVRTLEWPDIAIHRGNLDVKISHRQADELSNTGDSQ